MRLLWFITLLSAICLEGLGRKYMPSIPSVFFYFFKDVVLISGYFILRPPLEVRNAARWLFRGFTPIVVGGVVWTVLEVFNPEQQSLPLALTGLRAYWLWWLAPVLVASSLRVAREKKRAIYALLVMSLGIAALATVQFGSPPTSTVNLYSTVDGEQVFADRATVSSTGRARVSSTFSFLSGFSAFTLLVPALLLSLGLEVQDKKLRRACLGVALVCAAVVPMSGSRSAVILGGLVLIITTSAAGLIFTAIGRRVLAGAIIAVVLSTAAFPEAFEGVQARFENESETNTRILDTLAFLPPVALMTFDYPLMGIGTGMQQNARASFGVRSDFEAEAEVGRYLIELGPIGFLLVWLARFALATALFRAYRVLKRGGRRGASGAALSYATLTFLGNFAFDHIFQALFFLGCGFILSEVVEVHALGALAAAGMTPVAERR